MRDWLLLPPAILGALGGLVAAYIIAAIQRRPVWSVSYPLGLPNPRYSPSRTLVWAMGGFGAAARQGFAEGYAAAELVRAAEASDRFGDRHLGV